MSKHTITWVPQAATRIQRALRCAQRLPNRATPLVSHATPAPHPVRSLARRIQTCSQGDFDAFLLPMEG